METFTLSPIAEEARHAEIYKTPELLRGLSLHEITKTYGTKGLYTRLQDTLKIHGLEDNMLIQGAINLGLNLHNNDKRTNGHYGDHLLRVTLRIIEKYGFTDPNLIMAAMLHDSVEDHARELVAMVTKEEVIDEFEAREMAFSLISMMFNTEVSEIVRSVTNDVMPPGEDKNRFYTTKTIKTVTRSPKGRVLKFSDFTDNAIGNHYTEGPLQQRLDQKYLGCYAVHAIGLFLPNSLITGELRLQQLKKIKKGYQNAVTRIALTNS